MVIKTGKPISKYEEFFAMEADAAKGTNIKKAKLDNTVTDYTNEADDDTPDTVVKDDNADTKTTDYTNDLGSDENTDVPADTEDDAETDNTASSEDQSNIDNDEGTDYTSDNGDDDTPSDTDSPEATDTDTEPNEDDDIQTQKYNLYREFMRLYTSIKRYISKLENTVRDDINGNMVIISVTKKLREIQDLIYEYLTVKFHGAEYSEALLYFHSCIETIELTFKLLKNNEIFIKQ